MPCWRARSAAVAVAVACVLSLVAAPVRAQEPVHDMGAMNERGASTSVSLGAQAVALVTSARPAIAGGALTEGYLTQPAIMGSARLFGGRASIVGTLMLEGVTLRRGELNTGMYGEGFVDRRHPHTYVHELVGTLYGSAGAARGSLSFGRGYVPFGTDDPMMRPFVSFPVNHHLSQVLERLVAAGALRLSRVTLEAGTFNGDEPIGPGSPPNVRRFGDSWAVRATVNPRAHADLSASYADVASPEDRAGNGLRQKKYNLAARYHDGDMTGDRRYALLEWSMSDEYNRGSRAFRFTSVLGEGEMRRHGVAVALRIESTVRPEEERLLDLYRVIFPTADVQLQGRTRFSIASVALKRELPALGPLGAEPFLEVSAIAPAAVDRPAVFVPRDFYGASRIWNLSAGVRLAVGAMHQRMGRYGVAREGGH
ncbi:MAG: hypothetical protein ABJD07_07950 [Gemmatimonadaceae bacterium]